MKNILSIITIATLALMPVQGMAQEVELAGIRTPERHINAHPHRQGEVLVKFKDSSTINIKRLGGKMVSGKGKVDDVLSALSVKDCEKLMPLTGAQISKKKVRSYTGAVVEDKNLGQLYHLTFDTKKVKDVDEAVKALQKLEEVEYAEPNYIVYTQSNDSGIDDPMYSQQWGPSAINMPQVWDATAGATNVLGRRPVIAILDTGVDIEHPDLKANIWTNEGEMDNGTDDDHNGFKDDLHGWDFINQTGIIGDYNGHGTHCAGIAAAVGGNGIGIIGANPEALIMPVTVMQSNGTGDVATIIKGIDYASANGADILSMSFGSYVYSIAQDQALSKAYNKCILVAAAGNDGVCINFPLCHCLCGGPAYPGSFTYVLGVMAAMPDSKMAPFSNYDCNGPILSYYDEERLYNYELVAPGTNILSTYPGGRYKMLNGTSMACPMTAGAISRLITYKEYESKEMIFGDLIHSSGKMIDALAAYNITDADRKPNVHLVAVEYKDPDGDGDGRIDAGEIIEIYPTIRNEWGTARNVTVGLEFADNEDNTLCEFLTNDVELGCDLSSYGKVKFQNPIRVKMRDNIVDGRIVRMQVRAQCDNMSEDFEPEEFTFKVENGVELGGTQRENITLYPGIQYIVSRNWGIPKDVVVTVKAGTTIKIKDNVGISNYGNMLFEGTADSLITITKGDNDHGTIGNFMNDHAKVVDFNYVVFENLTNITFDDHRYNNCIIRNCNITSPFMTIGASFRGCEIYNNMACEPYISPDRGGLLSFGSTFIESSIHDNIFNIGFGSTDRFYHSNYIGNETLYDCNSPDVKSLDESNCFGNYYDFRFYQGNPSYEPGFYSVVFDTTEPEMFYLSKAYLGTANKDVALQSILDSEDNVGWGTVDVTQMMTYASEFAPLCVDYVKVDGYNPLDEADQMPPIGVGKHTVEVGFNRKMDQSVTPFITMGVRPPYTQNLISDEGFWFDPWTYRATITIDGKTGTDGTNRIRVSDFKEKNQNPAFSAPIEKSRYNILVSAAGSMSTGMMAEPGLGKVTLTWETDEEDFEDLMGYNLYRFTLNDQQESSDSILINKKLIESDDTEFVDYDVVPGTVYYYFIKEIGTDLQEHFVSKTVAASPLTSIKGDANGDMQVDVADVMSEVAYLSGENPQPFIYEAADVNEDNLVDILDVVGTLRIISSPSSAAAGIEEEETAYYTIEDGSLYIQSPVAVGGLQLNLKANESALCILDESLSGMELLTAQINAAERVFLSYSMSGKVVPAGYNAVAHVSPEVEIEDIILCTPRGGKIRVERMNGETGIHDINVSVNANAIYDLSGRRLQRMPQRGIVIVNGKKVCL